MEVHIEDNKLVTITEPKAICFDLSKDVDNNLKYKHNELLAEHTTKNEISQLLSKDRH